MQVPVGARAVRLQARHDTDGQLPFAGQRTDCGGEGARAVAGGPALLLADEPTGNLDSTNGAAVMELLRELTSNGSPICMVTHDARYARHADRAVRLSDGRVDDAPARA